MESIRRPLIIVIFLVILITAGGWYIMRARSAAPDEPLQASGSVEAVKVIVAPEPSGKIAAVLVTEGEFVQQGDALFTLNDEVLQAQRRRALSALEVARAGVIASQMGLENARAALEIAQAGLELASIGYDLELNLARSQDLPLRASAWQAELPDPFFLPVWYFEKAELIEAAKTEVAAAEQAYQVEIANFQAVLGSASNANLAQTEARLVETQAAFLVAEEVLNRSRLQDDQLLEDIAQTSYDAAEAELEASQSAFDQLLSESSAIDLLEARGRLAIAWERYESAMDRYQGLLTGADSPRVRSASATLVQAGTQVRQAEMGVDQAEANQALAEKAVAQAQSELALIDVQLDKLTVRAAVNGVILTRNIEPGEVIQAGGNAMTIGDLDMLTITVYVPEDQYGRIQLGASVQVRVDSFPGHVFDAQVVRIADQAEFTPRNVQTSEGRRTTVFAVDLAVKDASGRLKPGMPADVSFE